MIQYLNEKNIHKSGLSKYVTQHNLDLKTSKEIPVTEMDVALIDLGDPWVVIPKVRQMLKGSGAIFAICPTMNQLEKLTMALVENEFNLNIPRYVDTFEEEEPVDLEEVSNELQSIENDITQTDETISGFCDELNIKPPF